MERATEAGPTLVLTPGGRNGEVILRTLREANLECETCPDADTLRRELEGDGSELGAVILSEAALRQGARTVIERFREREPAWSALPVVLLTPRGRQTGPPERNVIPLQQPTSTDELLGVLRIALGNRARQRELDRLHRRLERMAMQDALTELPNRTALYQRLVQLQRGRRAADESFTAIFIDLDDFKTINDTYGHASGDEALRQVALFLKASIRSDDFVARLSGDEFIVLLIGIDSAERAADVAERLAQGVRVRLPGQESLVGIAISAGVFDGIDMDATPDTILARADAHMYAQKRAKQKTVPDA